MWRNISLFLIIFIFINCTNRNNQDLNLIYNNSLIVEGESHFKNIAQLTFSGENAEAYFSPDGKKLIYQSHDGGDFYSHDGSKIIWRAYYQQTEKEISDYKYLLSDNSIRPMTLQLWVMNADGSNKKQITNNGSANFGPLFFPEDNKIIFSSNMHEPKRRDFDLYSVNIDGSRLERITYFDGFNAFPMFSPNGKFLSSHLIEIKRTKETQIYLVCEWK